MEESTGISLAEQVKEIDAFIEQINNKLHLDKIKLNECNLDISRDDLLSMGVSELNGLRWDFGKYMLGLQKQINNYTAKMNWAESNLKRVTEYHAGEQVGYTWQERVANVRVYNEYAQKLDHFRGRSKLLHDQYWGIINRIEFLCKVIDSISYSKRKEDG
jgi:hypothetical protein